MITASITNEDPYSICQRYLHRVYQSATITRSKTITETYGEVLYPSMYLLLSLISISKEDIFVDLGSGLGKVVLQWFLQSPVKKALGIELIPELHIQAERIAKRVAIECPEFFAQDRVLQLMQGSFFDISFQEATIIFLGSPCFSPKMLHQLGHLIENTPSIHTVLSLRPLLHLTRLQFKKVIRVECSWDSALCYIYQATGKVTPR